MLVDRAKLLDFAANRLRSWRSEYQLYSVRASDPTQERSESDPHSLKGDALMASTISAGAEPKSQGETSMVSDDFLSTPTGSVDTLSITGLSPDAVLSKVSPSRPLKYSTSRPHESSEAHSSSDSPGVKIHRSTDERRTRSIKPLTEMLDAPSGAESALTVRFPRPKVVAQILGENKEHWARLAGGISRRVQESGLKSLMLTSALRGEGVTTLSTALAVALAENTKLRVLLLEGDFQAPTLARDLDVHPVATIDQCLFGEASLEDSIVKFTQPAFHVVPACVSLDASLASMAYGRINDMLISYRDHFDLVLLDLGGLFVGRKPIPVPSAVDAALLVRDASKTGPELFDQLDAYLARQGVASLGVIENGV